MKMLFPISGNLGPGVAYVEVIIYFWKCSPEQQMLKKYSLLRLRPFWIVWIKISTDTWNKTSRYLFKVLRSIWSNSILWQHPTISISFFFPPPPEVWTKTTFLQKSAVLKPIQHLKQPLNCSYTTVSFPWWPNSIMNSNLGIHGPLKTGFRAS